MRSFLVRTADTHLSQTENPLTSQYIKEPAKCTDLTIGSKELLDIDSSYSLHCFSAREPHQWQWIDTEHHTLPPHLTWETTDRHVQPESTRRQ